MNANISELAPVCSKVKLAGDHKVVAVLNTEPFEFRGDGIKFTGAVGLIIHEKSRTTLHPICASTREGR
jgi:hypothetical protein